MAIYLRRSALQSRLKALLSTRNLSFVPGGRNCNPDLAPKVPTLKDLTLRIAEKCESLTKNGVEKDNIEPNTELGSHSMNVAVAGKVDVLKWRKLDSRKLGIQKSNISPSSWAVLKILHGEARILGGLRIAARLGLSFSEETDTAIRKLSSSVTSLAKVFVSPNAGHNTSRLFSMLVDDVEANIQGRKGFKINYDLLKKGGYEETSFVLGKVITDTLKSEVSQEAAKRRRVLPTTANPVQNQFMGEIVANDRTEKQPVVDAKPEEVAQNQQNKDEKVTYDTILTRVSKLWYKLVRHQTVTEEDQKACRNVEHGDGKENLNFSEDGIILEKQETVIVNEEPEKVNNALPGSVLENGQDGVKKKPKQDDVTEIEVPTSRQLMTVGHNYYPKPVMNMSISHGGVCIFILGVLLSNKMKVQFTQRLPLGSELNMGEERCCLRGLDHLHGPTFHSICGNLMIYKPSLTKDRLIFKHDESLRAHLLPINFPASYKNGKLEHFLHRWMKNHEHNDCWLIMFPEKRYYRETMSTTEVAIHTNLFTDLYASIGTGSSTTGGWYITIMKLPFIFLIWIGFMVASLGGLRSLLRQLRKNKLHWN